MSKKHSLWAMHRMRRDLLINETARKQMISINNFMPFIDRFNAFDLIYLEHRNVSEEKYEIKAGGYFRGVIKNCLYLSILPLEQEKIIGPRMGSRWFSYRLDGIKRLYVMKETAFRVIKPHEKSLAKMERKPPELRESKNVNYKAEAKEDPLPIIKEPTPKRSTVRRPKSAPSGERHVHFSRSGSPDPLDVLDQL